MRNISKEPVKHKIEEISLWIEHNYNQIDSPFFLGGLSGMLLFLTDATYHNLYDGRILNDISDQIIGNEAILRNTTLSAGYSGILFSLYNLLNRNFSPLVVASRYDPIKKQ